mmetsp:Transcript_46613/g.116582  ORF Transcript_46613/g.116582 Transcript_46613/m.116582 type:complete len:232 (+) Transcript_46613:574-1269(+)
MSSSSLRGQKRRGGALSAGWNAASRQGPSRFCRITSSGSSRKETSSAGRSHELGAIAPASAALLTALPCCQSHRSFARRPPSSGAALFSSGSASLMRSTGVGLKRRSSSLAPSQLGQWAHALVVASIVAGVGWSWAAGAGCPGAGSGALRGPPMVPTGAPARSSWQHVRQNSLSQPLHQRYRSGMDVRQRLHVARSPACNLDTCAVSPASFSSATCASSRGTSVPRRQPSM